MDDIFNPKNSADNYVNKEDDYGHYFESFL